MKVKTFVISSVIIMIVSIYINFVNGFMGNPATLINFLTTLSYLTFWIVFVLITRNSKKCMIYSLSISLGVLVTAILLLIYNYADGPPSGGILSLIPYILVIVFFLPFYGFEFFETFMEQIIDISFISIVTGMLFVGIIGSAICFTFIHKINMKDIEEDLK